MEILYGNPLWKPLMEILYGDPLWEPFIETLHDNMYKTRPPLASTRRLERGVSPEGRRGAR